MGTEEGASVILIAGEEVVIEGSDAGEVEEGAAAPWEGRGFVGGF